MFVQASLVSCTDRPLFRKKESPRGEETTTSDYFASSTKPGPAKATPTKPKTPAISLDSTPDVKTKKAPATSGRGSARKAASTSRKSYKDDDDEDAFVVDDDDNAEDIFAAEVKGAKGKDDGYVEISDDEDVKPKVKMTSRRKPRSSKSESVDVEMKDASVVLDDDDDVVPAKKSRANTTSKKRKSLELDSEGESDDSLQAKRPTKSKTTPKKPAAKKAKKEDAPENTAMKAIFDSIPTIKAPSPPPKDPNVKFDWRKGGAGGGNAGPPPAAGSKEIPIGADNCLAGLAFVFTGLLETISREAGQELVKRYGGKITGAPSGKTSYVVLGSDAGPSKLEKIKKLNIKTINEDGLFELIRRLPANGGDSKAAAENQRKAQLEEEKIKEEAVEMEKEEKKRAAEAIKEAQRRAAISGVAPSKAPPATDSQLWTVKYAPTSLTQICGNKGQVEKLQSWLSGWQKAHKYKFEKKGKDGLGGYRAVIIHGPPGVGKTTAAHLVAKLEGYDVIESNASDTRSKKLVEGGLSEVLNNTSLNGYFAADGKAVDIKKQKIVLIMDEVDGMSAGDRGGVGALAKVCKTTDIPMILICNERKLPKMKPFDFVTYDLGFSRPQVQQIRGRLATICLREGLKVPTPVIDALVEGTNKDIRQIINMLSTAKLDQKAMDFDQGKTMSKAWEKHVVLKPWDICHKILSSGMFAPTSTATLNDKIELYFNDHEFSYLMLQENYLKTKPLLISNRGYSPKEERLKTLELADKAAESISDGDLVDRMIHGSQQQWSLMPTHAVFSMVRPASFMSGVLGERTAFTSWLGNNSKHGKLMRFVKEIQSHMRLRSSGDRHEIRQQYLPVLWSRLIKRLEMEGKDSVDDVIDLMDSYFLTRDDFDYIMELGLGPQDMEKVQLETQTKATFTRQ